MTMHAWTEDTTLPARTPVDECDAAVDRDAVVWGGRYAFRRRIRAGGMAVVYEADDRITGARVAVKRLKAEHARDPIATDRFEREGRFLGWIDHPHIIRRLDAGRDAAGVPYLVLEYLAGDDLQVRIEREGLLSVHESVARVRDVAVGLQGIHALGIVHHDVKPANVMLTHTRGGRPVAKLIDFGVACAGSDRCDHADSVLGTPAYLAPEQMFGEGTTDPRVDLWSVGAVLFCCLTGRPPHVASSMHELMYKVTAKDPDRIEVLRPDLPPQLVALIHRALSREPDRRFEDATSLLRALDAFTTAHPLHTTRAASSAPALLAAGPDDSTLVTSKRH